MDARPPPALPDEVVEEILLRVPPDDPARLMSAALACKGWCRLVSGPAFRRRFRERHRTPPVLGVISSIFEDDIPADILFIPTCSFRPRHADLSGWAAHHSRHGRVLLYSYRELWWTEAPNIDALAVWDPVTDTLKELPAPRYPDFYSSFNAAVLCAAAPGDCDHLDCSSGPFLVVLMIDRIGVISTYIYSSEADAWSEPISSPQSDRLIGVIGGAHAGNALYFLLDAPQGFLILEYDLGTQEMAVIDSPPTEREDIWPMTAKGGVLGCATMTSTKLSLWLREADLNGDMRWARNKVIQLEKLLPVDHIGIDVVGFTDGGGVVYVGTNRAFFAIDVKSGRCTRIVGVSGRGNIVYMSFCTPALGVASAGDGPDVGGGSSASQQAERPRRAPKPNRKYQGPEWV